MTWAPQARGPPGRLRGSGQASSSWAVQGLGTLALPPLERHPQPPLDALPQQTWLGLACTPPAAQRPDAFLSCIPTQGPGSSAPAQHCLAPALSPRQPCGRSQPLCSRPPGSLRGRPTTVTPHPVVCPDLQALRMALAVLGKACFAVSLTCLMIYKPGTLADCAAVGGAAGCAQDGPPPLGVGKKATLLGGAHGRGWAPRDTQRGRGEPSAT